MAAGRENFIFFLCPLDGVRFKVIERFARKLNDIVLTGCGSKTGAVLFMVQLRLRLGEDFLKAGLAVSKNIRFKAAIIR